MPEKISRRFSPDGPADAEGGGLGSVVPAPGIPDHELLRIIGQGSYGEVWLARSVMGTYRAVKIVYRGRFQDARPFEREFSGIKQFEPVSRTHGGLVNILQVGRNDQDGYFYYVMELGDADEPGESFSAERYVPKTVRSELLRRSRLPFEECLRLSLSLTAALEHLHQAGLVHRDIKPANIIFVKGTPKLADIGLVAAASEAQSYVGTEGFIPREGPGTVQADVYSLGKVLYEMSTGKDRQQFPEPVTALADLPNSRELLELNEIVLKACENDVRKRYRSAEEMHSDLLLLGSGKSVRRLHAVERRLAILSRGAVVVVVLTVIGLAVLYETNRQRRLATQAVVRLHVANGSRLMNDGDLFGSLLSFTKALQLDSGSAKREQSHRIRIASVLALCPRLLAVITHQAPVLSAAFDASGNLLITGGNDQTARVWDLASGSNRLSLTHRGPVGYVAFSPDNRLILTVGSDNYVHLWNAQTGAPLTGNRPRHIGRWIRPQPRFSADGSKLVTLVGPEQAQTWDVATGQALGSPLRQGSDLTFFQFSPDDRLLLTVGDGNAAHVWDVLTGELRYVLGPGLSVHHAAFAPNNRVVVTASSDGRVRFWDVATGDFLPPALEHQQRVDLVVFSPAGDRLLSKCLDKSLHVWDSEIRKAVILPIAQPLPAFNASFSPDGRRVVTFSGGNLLQMWDADNGELIAPILKHSDWQNPGLFSSDGSRLVTLQGAVVRVWDIAELDPGLFPIRPVAFFTENSTSPNGRFKAVVRGDNTVRTFDSLSGKSAAPPIAHAFPIKRTFFGADSCILITENADSRVRVWDVGTGEPLTPLLKTRYDLEARLPAKNDLPMETRGVADLLRLAQVLSGSRIDETGGFQPMEPEEIASIWQKLKTKYAREFQRSAQARLAWHQQEAQACEQAWNWWPALCHLDAMIQSRPDDLVLRHRRAYAQSALERVDEAGGGYLQKRRIIPPRDPGAPKQTIDLSGYYTGSRRGSLDTLAALPSGIRTFACTPFDVRGIIQLARFKGEPGRYPERVDGIAVGRKCQQLHFLHATNNEEPEGTRVGEYVVHFADNRVEVIAIYYGKDLRNCWTVPHEPLDTRRTTLVWMGSSPAVQSQSKCLRMFESAWQNPTPDQEILSVDFVSSGVGAGPFLVALTAD